MNYFRSFSGAGSHVSDLSASLREAISPKIGLLQVINYSQGRTNVLYGGSYLSKRFAVSVDYQTLYLPFRANPFSQGIRVTLRLRLFAFKDLRYVVRGRVQDETGNPVKGAALFVGEDLVITNPAGEFLVRRKTAGILPLQMRSRSF